MADTETGDTPQGGEQQAPPKAPASGGGGAGGSKAANPAALQAATARVAELEQQVAEWAPKVGAYDSLHGQFEQAKAEWSAKETGWSTEKTLLVSGITDPEAIEVVGMFYGKLAPEAGKEKPALGEWLSNPDALPKAVRAYLPSTEQKATGNQNQNTTQQPNPNRGATGGAPGGSTMSAEAISTMSLDAYRQNRTAIMAALGKR